MLVGWVGGKGARQIEDERDDVIGATCGRILRTFLNDPSLPDPSKVICSRWFTNKYTRGSYSHRTVDGDRLGIKFDELFSPITASVSGRQLPVVLFAGEATDVRCYSAVHGALLAGEKCSISIMIN